MTVPPAPPPRPTPVHREQPPPREPSQAEILSQDPDVFDCLFLVKNGIPFDVAFSLDSDMRLAWVVIFGQLNGLKFDWNTRSWERPA
jgi:hypothetical protein